MLGRDKLDNTLLTCGQGNFNQITARRRNRTLSQWWETRALPMCHQHPTIEPGIEPWIEPGTFWWLVRRCNCWATATRIGQLRCKLDFLTPKMISEPQMGIEQNLYFISLLPHRGFRLSCACVELAGSEIVFLRIEFDERSSVVQDISNLSQFQNICLFNTSINLSWLPLRSHICRTCNLARHLSLGSWMVRASHRSSEGCGFDSHPGLKNHFSGFRAWRIFIDHLRYLQAPTFTTCSDCRPCWLFFLPRKPIRGKPLAEFCIWF